MLCKIFAIVLIIRCSCQTATCSDGLDAEPLHMLQKHAAKVVKEEDKDAPIGGVAHSGSDSVRMTHVDLRLEEDHEAAFKAACFKFLQHADASRAAEVLNDVIDGHNRMHNMNYGVPQYEPSFTHRAPDTDSPRASSADAARIIDTPMTPLTMDWLSPQFDATSSHHNVVPYPFAQTSSVASGWALANNMQVSLLGLSHDRIAKMQKPDGLAEAVRQTTKSAVPEKQAAPEPNALPEKENLWAISTQTSYGQIDLYMYVQMIWGLVICMALVLFLFEYIHTGFLGFDASQPLPAVPGLVYKRLRNMLAGIVPLAKPYFWREDSKMSWNYGFLVLLLMFVEAFLDLGSTLMLNCWATAMFAASFAKLFHVFLVQMVNLTCKTYAVAYRNYVQTVISFEWRECLANHICNRWLKWHIHYYMNLSSRHRFHKIDNPEQRIQEDVRTVVHQMIEMGEIITRSVFVLLLYVPALFSICPPNVFGTSLRIPGWPFYLSLIWCFMGGLVTHIIANILISINWLRNREEAFYRERIGHVKRHSEPIAVSHSEDAEASGIREQYLKVKFLMWKGGIWQKRLTWFFQFYKDVEGKLCFVIFIPSFVKGQLAFGAFAQCAVMLVTITEALDIFASNYHSYIAAWRAASDRVLQFMNTLDELDVVGETAAAAMRHGKPLEAGTQDILKADFDVITTPAKEVIWSNLKIDVMKGQRLLITGMEGDGKSTLFRILCGIWPYFNGGRVTVASWVETMHFVPEEVVIPPVCDLRTALAYPEHSSYYDEEEMETVLRAVGLARLMQEEWYMCLPRGEEDRTHEDEIEIDDAKDESHALDRKAAWYSALSPGQLQRLAFAHVLLKKPQLLVFDGPLSSVNKPSCAELFKLLPDYLPKDASIISLSHDPETFAPLHDKHFKVKGVGIDRVLVPASWRDK